MADLPGAVLFACTLNAFRSPMAEALMKHLYGARVFVDSCGVRPEGGEPDPFVVAVMDEMGIDMRHFTPKAFDDLAGGGFDLIITLSPEAHHHALELTRTEAVEVEYWPTQDPSAFFGARDHILAAYRDVRDGLLERITTRFGSLAAPGV